MKKLDFGKEVSIRTSLYGMDSDLKFRLKYFNFMLKEKQNYQVKQYISSSLKEIDHMCKEFTQGVDILNQYSVSHPHSRWKLNLILGRN